VHVGRTRWIRLAAVAAALGLACLLSGCVVMGGVSAQQDETIGDFHVRATACASGSPGCGELGNSGAPAPTASGQILLAARVPDALGVPASVSTPEGLVFARSPSYIGELQRLSPPPQGSRWVGYISQVIDHVTTSGPQAFALDLGFALGSGSDGGPFEGPIRGEILLGGRLVSEAGPASRPVACGDSLTTLRDEQPPAMDANDVWIICADSTYTIDNATSDLGILRGAAGSGPPGSLASVPFALRFAGAERDPLEFRLTARTTLPGASVAVTPSTIGPSSSGTIRADVAVGIPQGARAGTYDVTLTARLANGQARAGTGTLTVLPGAGIAGGPAARLRLTTVLPRRLSATIARRRGIVVLIGANKAGPARVQLFQGRAKKPKAAKRVRLKVPGPTRVVLRSRKLVKGPYRVVITADGRRFVRRAVLTR